MTTYQHEVLAPDVDRRTTALYLCFTPSRGRVLGAKLEVRSPHPPQARVASHVPGNRNAWRFSLEGLDFQHGPPLHVRVATAEEPLAPAYFVEDLVTERRIRRLKHEVLHSSGERAPFESETTSIKAEGLLLDARTYAKALEASLSSKFDARTDPLRPYFVHLELHSNPDSGALDAETLRHIQIVTRHLQRRVRYRAVVGRSDKVKAPEALTRNPSPTLRRSVEALSRMQLQLIDLCFGAGAKFDPEKFHSAFQAFANGKLRRPVTLPGTKSPAFWITQPSSAYYLFFSEFAFLACECRVDEARWAELGNAMTYTQEVFASVYGPPNTAKPHFRDFKADNFHSHHVGQKEIDDLREAAAGKDVAGLRKLAAGTVQEFIPRHGDRF